MEKSIKCAQVSIGSFLKAFEVGHYEKPEIIPIDATSWENWNANL